jgi:hypothetical protein
MHVDVAPAPHHHEPGARRPAEETSPLCGLRVPRPSWASWSPRGSGGGLRSCGPGRRRRVSRVGWGRRLRRVLQRHILSYSRLCRVCAWGSGVSVVLSRFLGRALRRAVRLFHFRWAHNGHETSFASATSSVVAGWVSSVWTWWLTRNKSRVWCCKVNAARQRGGWRLGTASRYTKRVSSRGS